MLISLRYTCYLLSLRICRSYMFAMASETPTGPLINGVIILIIIPLFYAVLLRHPGCLIGVHKSYVIITHERNLTQSKTASIVLHNM